MAWPESRTFPADEADEANEDEEAEETSAASQAEQAEQAEAVAQGAQGAQGAEAVAQGEALQGGRATASALDVVLLDSRVVELRSNDGVVIRRTPELGLLWDFAIEQWSAAQRLRTATSGILEASNQAVSKMQELCASVTSATCAASAELTSGLERGGVEHEDERNGNAPVAAAPAAPVAALAAEAEAAAKHTPIVEAHAIPGPFYPYGKERWQTKKIGRKSISKMLSNKYGIEIQEDIRDAAGREYSVGETSKASYCGAFPHAIVQHKVGPHRGKAVYVCSGKLDIVLTIRLVDKRCAADDPERYNLTEKDVLNDLRRIDPEEVKEGWGTYENSMAFYAELQFHGPDDKFRHVGVNPEEEDLCAFKKAPANRKLLLPEDSKPYAGGAQEVVLVNGRADLQFGFAKGVTSKNLATDRTKDLATDKRMRLFCLAVKCLNPYLNGRSNFETRSLPFLIKQTLHNDLSKSERWVVDDTGAKVAVEKASVPRLAPTRRLAFAKVNGMINGILADPSDDDDGSEDEDE